VNRRDFDPALNSESRRIGTLYMKARKLDRFQSGVSPKMRLGSFDGDQDSAALYKKLFPGGRLD
jgi:hypothetical protein